MLSNRIFYILLIFAFLNNSFVQGQEVDDLSFLNNSRSKKINVQDSLFIDSLSIAWNSFEIQDVPKRDYILDEEKALLIWLQKPNMDSVEINYRVLPFSFHKIHQGKSLQIIDSNIAFPFYSLSGADSLNSSYVNFNSLDYNGTYGRSFSVGNQQDLSLNSNFNLQLNGYVLDSVKIEAALTDNHIPFQPEGNTQQIQEFDQLYIRFSKGIHQLTAGDFDVTPNKGHFLRFNKRVQGLNYQKNSRENQFIKNKIRISGSIAKGQFTKNSFYGQEGNQGPYKLTGNNGEQFFIILAGSEKVYIDGVLMERGEDRDYIIDYNTAEVSFMPRRMITKDKRIQIEFEYQDRNYLNTLINVYNELKIGDKWTFNINVFSNQDAKNQPYLQSLDGAQKSFLAGIGDDIDQAFYRVIKEDTFSGNKILYKMIDTLVNGIIYDSVFVYSTNPDSAKYNLGFSYVGEGKGDYIISSEYTNGRSYEWIAPIENVPQGSYEPVVLLVTPKKHQLLSLGTEYEIDSLKKISVELAMSNYNPNLFSNIPIQDHLGMAGKINYVERRLFGKNDSLQQEKWEWGNQFSYEFTQNNFKEIEPFRDVEFMRDWNLQQENISIADEHYLSFETQLKRSEVGKLVYGFNYLQRTGDFEAFRNKASVLYDANNIKIGGVFNLMSSEDNLNKGSFFRPSVFVERKFEKFANMTVGASFRKEENNLRNKSTDSLLPLAINFEEWKLYITNEENEPVHFGLAYLLRDNYYPKSNLFLKESRAHTIEGKATLRKWNNHQVGLDIAYRNLIVDNDNLTNLESEESLLSRLTYQGNLLQGFLSPSLMYEIGSGQEQKRSYVYLEVPAGQGIYTWIDYNQDGIQQTNEFEIAQFEDQKKYIRILTPTNEFVKVNFMVLNHSLQIAPENIWKGKSRKAWQKLLSAFSNQLSVQINNRVLADAGLKAYNPFVNSYLEDNIIANVTSLNNAFFINQKGTKWGIEHRATLNSGKSLMTYGLEANDQSRQSLKFRYNFYKRITAQVLLQEGEKSYSSALEDNRTYNITIQSVEPSLTWVIPSLFRLSGSYKFDFRENAPSLGKQKANIHSISLDSRLTSRSMGSIQFRGTYADIAYSGQENEHLSFIMLDALQKGQNWLWFLSWERLLGKGIEISLEYEGRKPGSQHVIHTGRMSIRALL